MAVTTRRIGEMFNEGATKGRSLNSEIVDRGNKTLLVDYGWAVLGERDKKSGRVTFYSGWDKYSTTTSKHIHQAGLRQAPRIINEKKKLSDVI